jgi:FlaA1/EpsC-like NDP-sugar epimerase
MKKALIQLKVLQIVIDGLLILAAFALAYFLRIGFYFSTEFPFQSYFLVALMTLPFTMLFMFFIRAYKLSQQIWSWRHIQRLTLVALENVFLFMILYYFTFREFFSRLILIYLFLLTLAFTFLWHNVFRWILKKASSKEIGVYRALIIGSNRPAETIVRMLITEKSHIKPVAAINAHGGGKSVIAGVPVVGKMNLFEKTIADHNIDVIIQADHLEQSLNIINYALANNIKYMMPPELLGIFQGNQIIEEVEGVPFLKVNRHKKWWHNIW